MTPETLRIRGLRPAKPPLDPRRPIDVTVERERLPGGDVAQVLTVFLAGSECPFTCVFCDLWRHTLDAPTPPGAIPRQIRAALERAGPELERGAHLKLYNASNFFEPRAVPPSDDAEILRLVAGFPRVVVECHPRLVGRRCLDFAARLDGRLEAAMGLETIHPDAVARIGKRAGPEAFRRAARTLRDRGIGVRAFVLVGALFVPPAEAAEWTVRAVRFALEAGADHVALVPLRGGNGEMERLARAGDFVAPTLAEVEAVFERCLGLGPGVVTVDTWDLERLATCPRCGPRRVARLERANLTGVLEPRRPCVSCAEGV